MFELFDFPFMQRAFLAGFGVSALLGSLGVFVTSRNMSFVGDGVAHASLAAVALAVLLGWAPLPVSLGFALILGVLLYYFDEKISLSQDVAIGVVFTSFLSLGIVLLQYHEGYVPELVSYLFGNILSVTVEDVAVISVVAGGILVLLRFYYRQLLFLTLDPDGAQLLGISRRVFDLLLYVFVSLAVVLSVKLVGIVLVTGLLVLPSAIVKKWARSFKQFLVMSTVCSVFLVFVGLCLSYFLDWPSGATIVLFGTLLLFLSSFTKSLIS